MGLMDGRVVMITGAARGQGRSHAIRLAEEGADVIALDLCRGADTVAYAGSTPADLEATSSAVESLGRRIVARAADITRKEELTAIVEECVGQLGRLDVVCANAGIWAHVDPESGEPLDLDLVWRETIETNLTGTWNTLEATVPILRRQGQGGSIIVTGSTDALRPFRLPPGSSEHTRVAQTAYTVSKHALVGLVSSAALGLAPEKIRVNAVHPGDVATPMLEGATAVDAGSESEDEAALPLGIDAVESKDVSEAILYFASDLSRYVTGVGLPVDGGYLLL